MLVLSRWNIQKLKGEKIKEEKGKNQAIVSLNLKTHLR